VRVAACMLASLSHCVCTVDSAYSGAVSVWHDVRWSHPMATANRFKGSRSCPLDHHAPNTPPQTGICTVGSETFSYGQQHSHLGDLDWGVLCTGALPGERVADGDGGEAAIADPSQDQTPTASIRGGASAASSPSKPPTSPSQVEVLPPTKKSNQKSWFRGRRSKSADAAAAHGVSDSDTEPWSERDPAPSWAGKRRPKGGIQRSMERSFASLCIRLVLPAMAVVARYSPATQMAFEWHVLARSRNTATPTHPHAPLCRFRERNMEKFNKSIQVWLPRELEAFRAPPTSANVTCRVMVIRHGMGKHNDLKGAFSCDALPYPPLPTMHLFNFTQQLGSDVPLGADLGLVNPPSPPENCAEVETTLAVFPPCQIQESRCRTERGWGGAMRHRRQCSSVQWHPGRA
jgi:hypothetical protein